MGYRLQLCSTAMQVQFALVCHGAVSVHLSSLSREWCVTLSNGNWFSIFFTRVDFFGAAQLK
jgi:hypothetical protein